MKKILYITDCTLNQCHSVRDILYNLLQNNERYDFEQIIANAYNASRVYYVEEKIEGYKSYRVPELSLKYFFSNDFDNKKNRMSKCSIIFKFICGMILSKIPRVRFFYKRWNAFGYFKKIIRTEKPDLIVVFYISPIKNFSKLCNKMNIPYISMLYDTYLERPGLESEEINIEREEIKNSVAYYVPNFFVNAYYDYYSYNNIFSYNLPLLIPKDGVIEAYNNTKIEYEFTYFGQIQSFRNGPKVKEIFESLGYSLNIFSMEIQKSDEVFIYHKAVSNEKLYNTVASSKFLVAFDNGEPYSHYLPSKAYLYVSFTKPIIVFGNNKSSALLGFLKDYPYYFYFNTESSSIDEIIDFVRTTNINIFDEKTYSRYTNYLPQNALKNISSTIKTTLDNQ